VNDIFFFLLPPRFFGESEKSEKISVLKTDGWRLSFGYDWSPAGTGGNSWGDGIYCDPTSRPIMQDCTIANNSATGGGAAKTKRISLEEQEIVVVGFWVLTAGEIIDEEGVYSIGAAVGSW